MDREYFVNQLMKITKQNCVEIDAEVLGMIVNKSVFRVVAKGGILQNQGEETKTAALVLNGICRAYYVDGDGDDVALSEVGKKVLLEIAFVVGKGLGAYLPDFVKVIPLPRAGFKEVFLWRLGRT